MALERTLSIIKPDAVAKNVIGEIYSRFEKAGLKVVAAKMKHLSKQEAEGFYAVHRERPFFSSLVNFMISGPVMVQALEGDNAVLKHRDLMGATNPKDAAPGTIRADFADSIDANAVHGSDSLENAAIEIAYFFPATDVYGALIRAMTDTRAPAIESPRGRVVGVARGRPRPYQHLRHGSRSLERSSRRTGRKTFRAQQVMKWIHHRHVTDFAT